MYLNLEIPVVVAKAGVRTRQLVTGDFDFENLERAAAFQIVQNCHVLTWKRRHVRTYARVRLFVRISTRVGKRRGNAS